MSTTTSEGKGWTPGPWVACADEHVPERGAIYISAKGLYDKNETIGEAYKTDTDVEAGTLDQTEANARLIAAAPELLDALKWCITALKRHNPAALALHPEWSLAHSAVAKAEGRST